MSEPQKFWRGQRVLVVRPRYATLPDPREAIIVGSYTDLHGGPQINQAYAIVILEGDVGVNWVAWFYESELSLIDTDRDKGEAILQAYNNR